MSDSISHGIESAVRMLTASNLAVTLTVLTMLSALTLGFHRLYLHPLRSHPGPLFARFTSLPDLYHAYRGDKHIHFLHLHAKYGPVVRFAPNSLSINDPAALRAIYGHGANVQKSESFYHAFRAFPTAISTLLATERVHHARKRRIMGQAFSEGAMRDLEKYVLENVRVWEREVGCRVDVAVKEGVKWTAGVDMGKWCNYLVFGKCVCLPLVRASVILTLRFQTSWVIWYSANPLELLVNVQKTEMRFIYLAVQQDATTPSVRCHSCIVQASNAGSLLFAACVSIVCNISLLLSAKSWSALKTLRSIALVERTYSTTC